MGQSQRTLKRAESEQQERKNKMFEELQEELQLSDEVIEKLNGVANKAIQSESDKVRTEYSKKIKELDQYKPKEKSAEQIELEQLKSELANTKFQKSLIDIGVSNDLGKYLKCTILLGSSQDSLSGVL